VGIAEEKGAQKIRIATSMEPEQAEQTMTCRQQKHAYAQMPPVVEDGKKSGVQSRQRTYY
jgi:hypothetical protein